MNWIKLAAIGLAALFIVSLVGGGYLYIKAKDDKIIELQKTIGEREKDIAQLNTAVKGLRNEIESLQLDTKTLNDTFQRLQRNDNDVRRRLDEAERKISERNLNALIASDHREMVLDSLNRDINGVLNDAAK